PAGGIPPPGSNQSFGNGAAGNPWPSQPQAPPYGYPPQQQQPSASSNPFGAPASSQQQSNAFGF
uniref:Uncharacterized protein n=1 Tax=Panagrolaimus sp. ES5 TaxID=591445 RepID=A0AC34G0N0_9BILA